MCSHTSYGIMHVTMNDWSCRVIYTIYRLRVMFCWDYTYIVYMYIMYIYSLQSLHSLIQFLSSPVTIPALLSTGPILQWNATRTESGIVCPGLMLTTAQTRDPILLKQLNTTLPIFHLITPTPSVFSQYWEGMLWFKVNLCLEK